MNATPNATRRNIRSGWLAVAISVIVALAAAMIWVSINRQTSGDDDAATDHSSETATRSTSPSEKLSKYCKQKVAGSPNVEVVVVDKKLNFTSKSVGFEFYLTHSSPKYVAVEVEFALNFLKDGKDVTTDLGKDFTDDWSNASRSVLPNAMSEVWEADIPTPSGWTENEIKLEVEVSQVGYWCTLKDKYVAE